MAPTNEVSILGDDGDEGDEKLYVCAISYGLKAGTVLIKSYKDTISWVESWITLW